MKNVQTIRLRIARCVREVRIFVSCLDDGSESDVIKRLSGQEGRERVERMLNSWLEELGAETAKTSRSSDSYRVAQQIIPDFIPDDKVVLVPEFKEEKKTLTIKKTAQAATI